METQRTSESENALNATVRLLITVNRIRIVLGAICCSGIALGGIPLWIVFLMICLAYWEFGALLLTIQLEITLFSISIQADLLLK